MEKQRIYTRPKTRDDMFKLFEQVFYEVRHWYANGNTQSGLSKHIRTTFKKRPSDLTAGDLTRANTMTLDEWMDFATEKYYEHLRQEAAKMKERREAQTKPAKEEVLPGFENEPKPEPVQTAIDFDKERIADNLGQLIIEVRKMNDAYKTTRNDTLNTISMLTEVIEKGFTKVFEGLSEIERDIHREPKPTRPRGVTSISIPSMTS